jgi:hypothetical protein
LADATDPALLSTLVEHCRQAAGAAAGLALARRLASWLAQLGDTSDTLCFGTVAATADDRLAVFLLGDLRLSVPETGTEISGADAAAWTDRLIPRPDTQFVLSRTGDRGSRSALAGLCDLRVGVVPGAAVALLPADVAPDPRTATQAMDTSRTEAPVASPTPSVSAAPVVSAAPAAVQSTEVPPAQSLDPTPPGPSAPRRTEALSAAAPRRTEALSAEPAPPVRSPLPSGVAALAEPTSAPTAQGHLCSRGHLNDPRSQFCVLCGIRMDERTRRLVFGPRPPLGLLVFDNGATYTVDADYLIGRNPESDPRVLAGDLRPIAVDDNSGEVSRVHAEVRLDNWDVLISDAGSSNGTAIAVPGQEWTELARSESVRLVPGTRIRLGDSLGFVFESPAGVR